MINLYITNCKLNYKVFKKSRFIGICPFSVLSIMPIEAVFHFNGQVNEHNAYYWVTENPQKTEKGHIPMMSDFSDSL